MEDNKSIQIQEEELKNRKFFRNMVATFWVAFVVLLMLWVFGWLPGGNRVAYALVVLGVLGSVFIKLMFSKRFDVPEKFKKVTDI